GPPGPRVGLQATARAPSLAHGPPRGLTRVGGRRPETSTLRRPLRGLRSSGARFPRARLWGIRSLSLPRLLRHGFNLRGPAVVVLKRGAARTRSPNIDSHVLFWAYEKAHEWPNRVAQLVEAESA